MKKIISIIMILTMSFSSLTAVFAYTDCEDEAVMDLSDLGVMTGYEDGIFKPDNNLTRAELSTLISRVSGISRVDDVYGDYDEMLDSADVFSDIDRTYWGYKYIAFCKQKGYLGGFEDGTFRPNDNVTLAQTLKICLTSIDYDAMLKDESSSDEDWTAEWMNLAAQYELADASDDPNRVISRIEAAQILHTVIDMPMYNAYVLDVQTMESYRTFSDTTLRLEYLTEDE